eukprot:1139125-Pelagomonas_calceolata.AAC.7
MECLVGNVFRGKKSRAACAATLLNASKPNLFEVFACMCKLHKVHSLRHCNGDQLGGGCQAITAPTLKSTSKVDQAELSERSCPHRCLSIIP